MNSTTSAKFWLVRPASWTVNLVPPEEWDEEIFETFAETVARIISPAVESLSGFGRAISTLMGGYTTARMERSPMESAFEHLADLFPEYIVSHARGSSPHEDHHFHYHIETGRRSLGYYVTAGRAYSIRDGLILPEPITEIIIPRDMPEFRSSLSASGYSLRGGIYDEMEDILKEKPEFAIPPEGKFYGVDVFIRDNFIFDPTIESSTRIELIKPDVILPTTAPTTGPPARKKKNRDWRFR